MSTGAIDVYWHECRHSGMPADDSWLASNELAVLQALRIPKRREDWRLGRWTAKQATASYLHLPADPQSLTAIEVRPADSGAPEILLSDMPAPVSISITHCNGLAACAVTQTGVLVGCDLEMIEPRSELFLSDYFTENEQAFVSRSPDADRNWLTTLLWSAKESALKALREGLRLDTRAVEVTLGTIAASEWHPLRARWQQGGALQGWWRRDDRMIGTLVARPDPQQPSSQQRS